MNIAIPDKTGGFHLLTNDDLQVGDKVYPIGRGYCKDDVFYFCQIDHNPVSSGWPDSPHRIESLNHSESKPYQVRTSRGYGPCESYFKLIGHNSVSLGLKPAITHE